MPSVTIRFASPDTTQRPHWRGPLEILEAALEAADPETAVRRHLAIEEGRLAAGDVSLDLRDVDRVLVVAAGKAAPGMVRAAEQALGEHMSLGIGVTARGTALPADTRTRLYEAGHPLPDPAGLMATRHIARLLDGTTPRDVVIALISGGASALLEMPAGRIPLVDLQAATSALLASGAPIEAINTVRTHISAVKGGRLARLAAPARVITLVLSDVVGSPLHVIASGPTVPDTTTFQDAVDVLEQHDLWPSMPPSVADHLRSGAAGRVPDATDPSVFDRCTAFVVGDGATAAEAAALRSEALGYRTMILTTHLVGEARECGRLLAAVGREIAEHDRPLAAPACVVASGETTVTLRHLGGIGGRNQELSLAAALSIDGWHGITIAAMDTDGIDGHTEVAGAIVDGDTAARGRALGQAPEASLRAHDSGSFFAALGDALRVGTGPTGTNVNDLTLVVVEPAAPGAST